MAMGLQGWTRERGDADAGSHDACTTTISAPTAPQIVVLGLAFAVMELVSDSVWATIAGRARLWMASRPRRLERGGRERWRGDDRSGNHDGDDKLRAACRVLVQDIGMGCLATSEWDVSGHRHGGPCGGVLGSTLIGVQAPTCYHRRPCGLLPE